MLTPTAYDYLSTDEVARRRKRYLDEIQPFLDIKAKIISFQTKIYKCTADTLLEPTIIWAPGSKELCDQIDEYIAQIGRQYATDIE